MRILSERKENVLSMIVDTYVASARPVPSRFVANKIKVSVSAATIRNEMGCLEGLGYITHPHTSAGRIPTDKGYRYYVDHLISYEGISPEIVAFVTREFERQIKGLDELMERASKILSTITRQAGIVSYPALKDFYFQRLDLAPLDARRLLAVWLGSQGWAEHHVVEMTEDVSQELLVRIENLFNQDLVGVPFSELKDRLVRKVSEQRNSLYRLYEIAFRLIEEGLKRVETHKVRVEGSSYILEQPEFQNLKKTSEFFHALEETNKLWNILAGSQSSPGVAVTIGGENAYEGMKDCAVVCSGYQWEGKKVGHLGIVGPKRMRYSSMVTLVGYVAREISRSLEQWL